LGQNRRSGVSIIGCEWTKRVRMRRRTKRRRRRKRMIGRMRMIMRRRSKVQDVGRPIWG